MKFLLIPGAHLKAFHLSSLAPTRRHPDSNWGIKDLQSSALPLGHAAIFRKLLTQTYGAIYDVSPSRTVGVTFGAIYDVWAGCFWQTVSHMVDVRRFSIHSVTVCDVDLPYWK
jgi:hypothetical protein